MYRGNVMHLKDGVTLRLRQGTEYSYMFYCEWTCMNEISVTDNTPQNFTYMNFKEWTIL